MLVLSRKLHEKIMIGDNIVVTITKVGENRVSLGITAPTDIKITRGELECQELPTGDSSPTGKVLATSK